MSRCMYDGVVMNVGMIWFPLGHPKKYYLLPLCDRELAIGLRGKFVRLINWFIMYWRLNFTIVL